MEGRNKGRRGPYKRYLTDSSILQPRTSRWRQEQERREAELLEAGRAEARKGNVQDDQLTEMEEENDGSEQENSDSSSSVIILPNHEERNSYAAESDGSDSDERAPRFKEDDTIDPSVTSEGDREKDRGSDSGSGKLPDNNSHTSDEHCDLDQVNEQTIHQQIFSQFGRPQYFDHNEHEGEDGDQGNLALRGPPLYPGCPISTHESDILVMSFVIRWGLEEKSIEHLLELIDCHIPYPSMGSKYLFLKKFPSFDLTKIRLMCSTCFNVLPELFQEGNCGNCNAYLTKTQLKASGNFFLQLSVTDQLRKILQNHDITQFLRRECNESDVLSGKVYRSLKNRGVIGPNDITLQWNTDGVSPFKSSKMQIWPIQACINELPYRVRRDNMILCGLYFGKTKPYINSFLEPFVEELHSLHFNGFQCQYPNQEQSTTIKVHTILASVDSIARPTLQGIKQFNGSYGCSFCLRRGMIADRRKGTTRVYMGDVGNPRTLDQHLHALQRLIAYNETHRKQLTHYKGVKHPSVLLNLPIFNIINSFVPDYLHCVLEGVVKTFISFWSDYTHKDEEWYLSKAKRTIISERLKAVMPPVEITRAPRGLDDLALLKASELNHFLLYYSLPSLKGILPDKYLKHWFLLVYSIYIYLQEIVSDEDAQRAKHAITKFVDDIQYTYPLQHSLYTFNVHLLLHIPQSVKNFGGLWGSSTFPYEHFNGVLARLITGTRGVPEQICRSFSILRHISCHGSRIFAYPDSNDKGRDLFLKLISKYHSSTYSHQFHDGLRLFGSPESYNLSLAETHCIEELGGSQLIKPIAQSYRRLIFRGTVFHASFYEALTVRNNSTVKLLNGKIINITRILIAEIHESHEKFCVVLGEDFDKLEEPICRDVTLGLSSGQLMTVCRKTNRVISTLPENLFQKCVLVPYQNKHCAIPLVNSIERD